MGRAVRNTKTRQVRWSFSMHSLESNSMSHWTGNQLSSWSISTQDICNGFRVTTVLWKLSWLRGLPITVDCITCLITCIEGSCVGLKYCSYPYYLLEKWGLVIRIDYLTA